MVNTTSTEENIKKIFFEVFPNLTESTFDFKKGQKDYDNWDSFAQLNLITLAELKFNIKLTLEDAISIKSAQDLLECVSSHL